MVETPLMKQYYSVKAKYPDALLLFRVGDFYETFGEDAIKTSKILGIVLTRRANGAASYVELAGFPYHALDTYLPKMVRAGYRVAICEQLEDPRLTKKLVKRGITELVTPGVSFNDKILDHKENNFLAGVHLQPNISGISFLDVSTGEFLVAEGSDEQIDKLLQTLRPSEIIVQKSKKQQFIAQFGEKFYINTFDDWVFTQEFANELLINHFKTVSLKGFGIEEMKAAVVAAGAALHYLAETHHEKSKHICKVSRIEQDTYVWLDPFTVRNLELVHPLNPNSPTLLQTLDRTISPMGSRTMKRWLLLPLKDRKPIEERHAIVDYFIRNVSIADGVRQLIRLIGDIERLISKAAVRRVNPRDVMQFKRAHDALGQVRTALTSTGFTPLEKIAEQINPCPLICERIGRELKPEPPVSVNKGHVIADGVNTDLDELRNLLYHGREYLAKLQQRESERTGIPSLKIGYNSVFGYYLEVTNTHKDKVPAEWHRKQTLVNCERYITEELKEYEQKILGAEEKIIVLEQSLFDDLVVNLHDYIAPVQLNASLVARIDCLLSFASTAVSNRYFRPEMNDSWKIEITAGRHPVIEQHLPAGEEYVPNDLFLDNEDQQIMILTGPNMSGKSALLRQTALIQLMAQTGSFVPASTARLGVVDKIFTRVGASDNISSGESTFMVEMNETANILNNISNRSLILLDEIGRGTSTYDGISIAWAIAEYLHEHPVFRPKILFATHYHELNEMAASFARIRNYHVSVKEVGNKVLFIRKLKKGGSEHSFGIHVARMAGMPQRIIDRANQLLKQLEQSHSNENLTRKGSKQRSAQDQYQLSFIQLNDPLLEQIREDVLNTDINTLTPVEALMKLNEIKRLLGAK